MIFTTCPTCGRPHRSLTCTSCMPEISPEKNRERTRQWRLNHPELAKARDKAYREKAKAKRAAQFKAWREANREKVQATQADWRSRNPEKIRAQNDRYRVKEALAAVQAAKTQPVRPINSALRLKSLAEAKATQATYGIQRIAYQ